MNGKLDGIRVIGWLEETRNLFWISFQKGMFKDGDEAGSLKIEKKMFKDSSESSNHPGKKEKIYKTEKSATYLPSPTTRKKWEATKMIGKRREIQEFDVEKKLSLREV